MSKLYLISSSFFGHHLNRVFNSSANKSGFIFKYSNSVILVTKEEGKMVRTDANIDEIEKKRDEMTTKRASQRLVQHLSFLGLKVCDYSLPFYPPFFVLFTTPIITFYINISEFTCEFFYCIVVSYICLTDGT